MKYFIIAGEASGDLHASNLMRELRAIDPKAEFCFLGGDLMLNQGGEMVKHYSEMAFMGFWAVLKNGRKVLRNFSECKRAMLRFKPDVLILVDYPSFNLRMARFAKQQLNVPVHYYISPKIWAWKEHRIKQIKQFVDKMFTIFPFETKFYAKHGYPVEYVGNPTVDSVSTRLNQQQTFKEFTTLNGLTDKPVLAILAGSRKQEIQACLPRMIEAAEHFSTHQIVIAGAPGILPDFYKSVLGSKSVQLVFGQTYELLQQADAAVVNSGTATLETALLGVPQVVVYHVIFGRLAYLIKDLVIKVKFFSLVNLVAEKEVVKELVAHQFTVQNVVAELEKILHDEKYRRVMLSEYSVVQKTLGQAGAARRTAEIMKNSIC